LIIVLYTSVVSAASPPPASSTLSLHDALPISLVEHRERKGQRARGEPHPQPRRGHAAASQHSLDRTVQPEARRSGPCDETAQGSGESCLGERGGPQTGSGGRGQPRLCRRCLLRLRLLTLRLCDVWLRVLGLPRGVGGGLRGG